MRLFLSLFFTVFVFSVQAQPLRFKLRPMEGYYIIGDANLGRNLNFMVISDERTFIRLFGEIDKEDYPNFDYEHVVVMAMQPTKKQFFLSFDETAIKAGDFIEVYCSVRTEKHELTYLDHPIVVAALPKYLRLSRINFYEKENKKLLKTVGVR